VILYFVTAFYPDQMEDLMKMDLSLANM